MKLTAILAVLATLALASTVNAASLEPRSLCKPLLSFEEHEHYVKAVAPTAYEKFRVVGKDAVVVFHRFIVMSYVFPPIGAFMNKPEEIRFYVRDDHNSAMILTLHSKTASARRGRVEIDEAETCVGWVSFFPKEIVDLILNPDAAKPRDDVGA